MKTTRTLSLMICLLMAVGTVQAQENIKRAIDEFLDDTRVNYTESHHKNRNPETGEMEGRLDAYTFTLAALEPHFARSRVMHTRKTGKAVLRLRLFTGSER